MFLNGLEVYVNNYIQPEEVRYQFRFPKSKKKRIRVKWTKRSENYKIKIVENVIQWDNKIFMSQSSYDKLFNK